MRRATALGFAVFAALPFALAASPDGGGATHERAAGSGCADEVARKVQAYYDAVRDLSADFEQRSRIASLGTGRRADPPATASGAVVFAKPGRMRWSYEKPEPSLVVSDGLTLWTYEPGLGEAQRMAVAGGMLSGAALQFLLGESRILETYAVATDSCDGERIELELLPLRPAGYERLGLVVERGTGRVVETIVADLFGNVTRVTFHNIRINRDPDPELFRFKPPEGVRVLEVPTAP